MSLLAGDGHMDACVTGSVSPAIVPSARTLEVTLERLYQWTFQRDFRWKLQSGEGTASTSQQTARKSLSPSTPSLWAVFIWAAVGKQRLCRYRAWHSWGSALCVLTSPLLSYLCSSFWGTCWFGSTCVWSLPIGQWCCRLERFTGGTGP